jgi:hypothetical protein
MLSEIVEEAMHRLFIAISPVVIAHAHELGHRPGERGRRSFEILIIAEAVPDDDRQTPELVVRCVAALDSAHFTAEVDRYDSVTGLVVRRG